MENAGGGLAGEDFLHVQLGIGAAVMEEGAGAALLSHDVRVGGGFTLQDVEVAPVDAELVASVDAELAEIVVADAAARIEGQPAAHAGQVHEDVVGEPAQAPVHAGDGGKIPLLGINVDEFDGVNHPVARRNDAFSLFGVHIGL